MGAEKQLGDFTNAIVKRIGDIPAYLADNAVLFAGKTIDQLRRAVTPAQVGLGNISNFPMNNLTQAQQGVDDNVYTNPSGVKEHVDYQLRNFKGEVGDCFFLNDNGFSNFLPGKFYNQLSIVTSDAELNQMLSTEEKMSDVFYSWKKISRGKWNASAAELEALGYSDNAIQEDLDAFTYDAATDKIKNPRDTLSFVGFISPNAYEDYVLDVVLKSDSNWQNDPMGLIVGYCADANGNTHTLSVMFNPWGPGIYGGASGVVTVYVDYNTAFKVPIHAQRANLHWVDGTPATGNMNPPPPNHYGVKPWNLATNGARLRITRTKDVFKVEMTEYDSTVFVDAASFTFDLNQHPSLAQFKGPQRYGYAAISQDLAIWNVITRPGARQPIIDLRDRSVRQWDGSKWVVSNDGWGDLIKPNRFYHNTTTKRLYYAENETSIVQLL